MDASSAREGSSMTAAQDERITSNVFNPVLVFCSKATALSYPALNLRDPDEQ